MPAPVADQYETSATIRQSRSPTPALGNTKDEAMSRSNAFPSFCQLTEVVHQVVLARLEGYPSWPGLVVDPHNYIVPDDVRKERKSKAHVLVQFLDYRGDYAWISPANVKTLTMRAAREAQDTLHVSLKADLNYAYRSAETILLTRELAAMSSPPPHLSTVTDSSITTFPSAQMKPSVFTDIVKSIGPTLPVLPQNHQMSDSGDDDVIFVSGPALVQQCPSIALPPRTERLPGRMKSIKPKQSSSQPLKIKIRRQIVPASDEDEESSVRSEAADSNSTVVTSTPSVPSLSFLSPADAASGTLAESLKEFGTDWTAVVDALTCLGCTRLDWLLCLPKPARDTFIKDSAVFLKTSSKPRISALDAFRLGDLPQKTTQINGSGSESGLDVTIPISEGVAYIVSFLNSRLRMPSDSFTHLSCDFSRLW